MWSVNLRVYPQEKLDLRAARKSITSPLPDKLYFEQTIDLVHECHWYEHIGQNMRSEINNRYILLRLRLIPKYSIAASQSFLFSNPKTHRTQHITRTNWINDKKSYLSTSCILCVGVRESTDWVTLQMTYANGMQMKTNRTIQSHGTIYRANGGKDTFFQSQDR